MEIKRSGSQPSSKGPAGYFTGTVRVDSPFKGSDSARVSGAIVTFEPGARTAWHTHPLSPIPGRRSRLDIRGGSIGILHGRHFINPVPFAIIMAMQCDLVFPGQQRLLRGCRRFLDGCAGKIDEDFSLFPTNALDPLR